ncbi:MAG: NADH dehydrogenase [Firmicutes bacterium ADurb.Bin506]|jgi:nitroreductase|nr:MAG: NADH dehydrogenase [Firmicutes bacterium ADurb.Bin506]
MDQTRIVIDTIKRRRAVRHYRPDPVAREVIEEIVDCGRLAPSARNDQPWDFVVVTDRATREAIAAAATYGRFIADAPVCVLAFARRTPRSVEDTCAAVENMLIAATAHGLSTCWVAGENASYARQIGQIVGAPESVRLVAMFPMGYSDDKPLPNKRSLDEVLHWEKY